MLVGMVSLHNINYIMHTAAIGYWLDEDNVGRGIITDAVKTMIRYAFDELAINRIEIRAAVGNIKSRAIPERLGFRQEGILRQAECVNGIFMDMAVYVLLKSDDKQY